MLITDKTSDVTSCIKVSWLPPDIAEEFITDFFENSKRSGGGDVQDVAYDEKNNTAIITFQDPAGYFQYFDPVINHNTNQIHRYLSILNYCQTCLSYIHSILHFLDTSMLG